MKNLELLKNSEVVLVENKELKVMSIINIKEDYHYKIEDPNRIYKGCSEFIKAIIECEECGIETYIKKLK